MSAILISYCGKTKKNNGKKTPNKSMHWKTSRAVFQMTFNGYLNSSLRITLVGNIARFQ
jgi:hypothetical protein